MVITQSYLKELRDEIEAQRGQLIANINAFNGAIEILDRIQKDMVSDQKKKRED